MEKDSHSDRHHPLQASNGLSLLGSDPKRSTCPSGSSTFISYAHE
jgi:hypothetical protein